MNTNGVWRSARVAAAGAALLSLGFAAGLHAQGGPGKVKVTEIFQQDLVGMLGKEVRVLEVATDPGAGSPAHRHPGHTIVCVIEGELETKVGDGPVTIYKAGECFYEAPDSVHAVSRNPSTDKPSRAIAFMFKDKNRPTTTLAPPPAADPAK